MTKSSMVAALARDAPKRGQDQVSLTVLTMVSRKKNAIKLLRPAIRNGFQSRILMKSPAVLQRKAQVIIAMTPFSRDEF